MPTADELSRRRRLVYHGLTPHLPAASVRTAVRLTDDEFRADDVFSVNRFLARLAEVDAAAAADKVKLFAALQRLRGQPVERLGPDPFGGAAPAANGRATSAPVTTGWPAVFNALLGELTHALELAHPTAGTRAMRQVAGVPLGISSAAVAELQAWLKTGTPAFTANTTRKEMHAVLHAVYLWACDDFGPVPTDRLFARAIKEVEKLPAAVQHPPQSLL